MSEKVQTAAKGGAVLVSKAPDDPDQKKAWANQMLRVQVAMWVDDHAACAQCRKPYSSVDDFLARNPRAGDGLKSGQFDDYFVDDECWPAYLAAKGGA